MQTRIGIMHPRINVNVAGANYKCEYISLDINNIISIFITKCFSVGFILDNGQTVMILDFKNIDAIFDFLDAYGLRRKEIYRAWE